LTFNNKDDRNDQLVDKTIILEAKVTDNKISWQCTHGSLENKYRPNNCISNHNYDTNNDYNLYSNSSSNSSNKSKDLSDSVIEFIDKTNLI